MEHYPSEEFEGAVHQWAQSLTIAIANASSEARYENQSLRGTVNSDDEVDVGSRSADRGSMELAIEVERAYSQAKRRNLYLQGLVCEACEALDRVPQRS